MLAYLHLIDSSYGETALILMSIVLIIKAWGNLGTVIKWLLMIGVFILLLITDAIIWIPIAYFALIVCACIVSFVRKKMGYKPIKRRRKMKKALSPTASEEVVHTKKAQGTILDYILVGIVAIAIVSSIVMLISGIID